MNIHAEGYVKLNSYLWLEYNRIPSKWRKLFLVLACYMSSYNFKNPNESHIVVMRLIGDSVVKDCGWKTKDPLFKGLRALCDCNVIRKVSRGVYQVGTDYVKKEKGV